LIVITQSCDLEHGNVSLVALCPIWSIPAPRWWLIFAPSTACPTIT
jgi:hypothetical protein